MPSDETAADRRARFEELAPQLVEPLRRFLVRRTDPATADDVLADTLLVCWRRLDEIPAAALPWAYGVARHCLANADRGVRRQQRVAARIAVVDPPPLAAPPGPSSAGTVSDREDAVVEALAAMRPEEAELLRLWAWEELSPAEIAAVLGVSPNAVSIRLHRARGRLRDELRKIETAPGHEESTEGRDR